MGDCFLGLWLCRRKIPRSLFLHSKVKTVYKWCYEFVIFNIYFKISMHIFKLNVKISKRTIKVFINVFISQVKSLIINIIMN